MCRSMATSTGLRAFRVCLLLALTRSLDVAASSAASPSSARISPSDRAPASPGGMLVWKGHWFAGGVRVIESGGRGAFTIIADSLDARPLLDRSVAMRLGPDLGRTTSSTRNLSESPPTRDSLLRISTRVLEFEHLATAVYIRMRDRLARDRQIADSLNALAARFADAVDSVRLGSYGYAEYRHEDPYPWAVAVNLAPLSMIGARTPKARTQTLSEEINEHLEKGRTVIVWDNGVITILPPGRVRDLYDQLSALRAGRVPKVTIISDSTTLHQLLTPEPLEGEDR